MYIYADLNSFFKNYGIYMAIAFVAIIAIIVLFLLLRNARKGKNKKQYITENAIIDALGGIDNIKTGISKMSRLNLELIDDAKIKEEELKQLGVARIIKMSKKTTLVIGKEAQDIENLIKSKKGT